MRLESQGYSGAYSFEPFSEDVQQMSLDALHDDMQDSIALLMGTRDK
jgi:predicted xylose isomerase-like sugar epimerase